MPAEHGITLTPGLCAVKSQDVPRRPARAYKISGAIVCFRQTWDPSDGQYENAPACGSHTGALFNDAPAFREARTSA